MPTKLLVRPIRGCLFQGTAAGQENHIQHFSMVLERPKPMTCEFVLKIKRHRETIWAKDYPIADTVSDL